MRLGRKTMQKLCEDMFGEKLIPYLLSFPNAARWLLRFPEVAW
jgi:hypothetical protein